jgi:hypothetical protein
VKAELMVTEIDEGSPSPKSPIRDRNQIGDMVRIKSESQRES